MRTGSPQTSNTPQAPAVVQPKRSPWPVGTKPSRGPYWAWISEGSTSWPGWFMPNISRLRRRTVLVPSGVTPISQVFQVPWSRSTSSPVAASQPTGKSEGPAPQ